MFLWARLPAGVERVKLLPRAIEKGVAFVPGAAFYAGPGDERTPAAVLRDGDAAADRGRHRGAGRRDPGRAVMKARPDGKSVIRHEPLQQAGPTGCPSPNEP